MKIGDIKKEINKELKNQIIKRINEQVDSKKDKVSPEDPLQGGTMFTPPAEKSVVSPFPKRDVSGEFEKTGAETPSSKKGTEQFQQRMVARDEGISKNAAKLAMEKVSETLGKSFMDIKDNEKFRAFVMERIKTNSQRMGIQPTIDDIIGQTTMSLNTMLFSLLREELTKEMEDVILRALKSK